MSERLKIEGGNTLEGRLHVPGAKNAALPELAACMLTERQMILQNVPQLLDVENMCAILRLLGCCIERRGEMLFIDASSADQWCMPAMLSRELRSSIFLLGPVLSRFGQATFTYPGGCEIGLRPIDLHLKGLRALGARIEEEGGMIHCDGRNMHSGEIHLDYPSVGATENLMMAAVRLPGLTRIHNAAKEPELCDLQQLLNSMGASVHGAGGSTIEIEGCRGLHGAQHAVMPDRIAAGTYLAAAAITGGELTLTGADAGAMRPILAKLREMGCRIVHEADTITLSVWTRLHAPELIETMPHPGFPTDMQAQMMALCTAAQGSSMFVENIFENRFKHVPELIRMGAKITIRGRSAMVRGVARLRGADVCAQDLRGGAALVLAALWAEGTTRIENVRVIDRGYERLEAQLSALGANICREQAD